MTDNGGKLAGKTESSVVNVYNRLAARSILHMKRNISHSLIANPMLQLQILLTTPVIMCLSQSVTIYRFVVPEHCDAEPTIEPGRRKRDLVDALFI